MYRSILIPLDGSTFAEQALPVACAIARRARARLVLTHVHLHLTPTPISIEGMPVIDERLRSLRRDHERAYLTLVRDRLAAEQPEIDFDTQLLEPVSRDPCAAMVAGTLAGHVAKTAVDLIVMTTHGCGGLARFGLGSVATALTQQSPAPTLFLRPHPDGRPSPPLGGSDSIQQFQRILVPLDGSQAAERMVYPALRLGRSMGSNYALLRIVKPTAPFGAALFAKPTNVVADRLNLLCAEAQADLDRIASRMRLAGASVTIHVQIANDPARAIIEAAKALDVAIIIMTTQVRRRWRRVAPGSITEQVICGYHLPVLVCASQARPADEALHPRIQLR